MKAPLRYHNVISRQFETEMLSLTSVGGGSINACFRVETGKGTFFLKENKANAFPGMFEAEKKGLALLKKTNAFIVPGVFSIHEEDGFSMLLMEWLERTAGKNNSRDAGKKLAQLHKNTSATFGLDHDNYIGSLPQSNTQHKTWAEFFAAERILPQLKLALDHKKIDASLLAKGENFCRALVDIFPAEAPALLHGDLWSGNFFFSPLQEHEGCPAIFDPAVYYGHREMDLAMTKLFGGFDAEFYEGYEEAFPLEKNWRSRTAFCNLYPLLVHVNLFGGGYVWDVRAALAKF